MTATSPEIKKLQKAAAERVRKLKIKAAESGQTAYTWGPDRGDDKFCLTYATPEGEVGTVADATGLTLDEAKAEAKTRNAAPASAPVEPTPEPDAASAMDAKTVSVDDQTASANSSLIERPEGEQEFNERNVYLFVFDLFGVSASEVGKAFEVDTKTARAALKKLQRRQLVDSTPVNSDQDGNVREGGGQYGEHVWQTTETYDSITREQAEQRFDEMFNAPRKRTTVADGSPRSAGRKLVAEIGGQTIIVRMSERQQAASIVATGSLPKIGDVEFKRADGTTNEQIVAAAASAPADDES